MAEKKSTTVKKAAAKAGAPKKAAAAPRKKTAAKKAVARPVTRTVAPPAPPKPVARPAAKAAPKPKPEPRPLPTAPAGQAPVIGVDGKVTGTLALPAALVSAKRRAGVLFQALMAASSNARLGTAATKNRARVKGGGAKPWRQKGTGRARAGSTRSPLWRHGGVVFGPNGRRYRRRLPGKMRREAFAEAFAARAGEGRVLVYEGLSFDGDRPRTKAVVQWLDKLGDTGRVLFVTPDVDVDAALATANEKRIALRSVGALRTSDVLTSDTLLVRKDALEALVSRATVGGAS